jgi:hypothetical protein
MGTRAILGPAHSQMKFPIVKTPVTKEGGVAAFKVEEVNGRLQLTPAWVSRDMHRAEPVVIVNGMVFGYGSGEETKQAWVQVVVESAGSSGMIPAYQRLACPLKPPTRWRNE